MVCPWVNHLHDNPLWLSTLLFQSPVSPVRDPCTIKLPTFSMHVSGPFSFALFGRPQMRVDCVSLESQDVIYCVSLVFASDTLGWISEIPHILSWDTMVRNIFFGNPVVDCLNKWNSWGKYGGSWIIIVFGLMCLCCLSFLNGCYLSNEKTNHSWHNNHKSNDLSSTGTYEYQACCQSYSREKTAGSFFAKTVDVSSPWPYGIVACGHVFFGCKPRKSGIVWPFFLNIFHIYCWWIAIFKQLKGENLCKKILENKTTAVFIILTVRGKAHIVYLPSQTSFPKTEFSRRAWGLRSQRVAEEKGCSNHSQTILQFYTMLLHDYVYITCFSWIILFH